jgi:acyl-CoA reductase-like NAD-dependent aldehyde dehydrogenase
VYQAYPIALQRAPERLDFLPALVGELRLAKQLQAGSVYINRHADVAPNAPFGGIKGSGLGVKFGLEGLHDD